MGQGKKFCKCIANYTVDKYQSLIPFTFVKGEKYEVIEYDLFNQVFYSQPLEYDYFGKALFNKHFKL